MKDESDTRQIGEESAGKGRKRARPPPHEKLGPRGVVSGEENHC